MGTVMVAAMYPIRIMTLPPLTMTMMEVIVAVLIKVTTSAILIAANAFAIKKVSNMKNRDSGLLLLVLLTFCQ